MFEIDKDIELPTHEYNNKYLFRDMKIGDVKAIKGYEDYRLVVRAANQYRSRHTETQFYCRWDRPRNQGTITRVRLGSKRPKNIPSKYPFLEMEVGDSFVTTGGREGYIKTANAARQYASRQGRDKINFSNRWDGKSGRIWRIK